jgi:carbon-monoxide dehydrogenase medium subunit
MPEGEMTGVVLDVLRPASLDELLRLLADLEGPRRLLAGGTDLLAQAKDEGYPPATWIDIWSLDELRGIDVGADTVTLGANTTMTDVEHSAELKAAARALWDGCYEAGSVQIRNRATLGGNAGNASPAADSVPGLISLGAICHLVSRRGEREVLLEELALRPRKTVIAPDELITRFSFPRAAGSRGAFLRLGQRRAQAISKVSVAATATFDGDAVAQIRIALGAVAATIVRAPKTEAFLSGKTLDPGVLAEAMEIVRTEATPITDVRSTQAYRVRTLGIVLKRVLERLV